MHLLNYIKKNVIFILCVSAFLAGMYWNSSVYCMVEVQTPPMINKVIAESCYSIMIKFKEVLDKPSAETAENYVVDKSIGEASAATLEASLMQPIYYILDIGENVKSAILNADSISVMVTLPDNLIDRYNYCILLRNIKNTDNNTMNSGAALFMLLLLHSLQMLYGRTVIRII